MANYFGTGMAAGKAGGAYSSSLQDIMNIQSQQDASNELANIKQGESDRIFGAIQQGISLAGTVAGGIGEQKEAAKSIEGLTEKGGKITQTVGESKFGDFFRSAKGTEGRRGVGESRWGELGEKLSTVFGGREREYDVSGVEGIGDRTYKQSDLLARAKQSTWDELGLEGKGGCPDGQHKDPIIQQCVDFVPQPGP